MIWQILTNFIEILLMILLLTGSRQLTAAQTVDLLERGLEFLRQQGHPVPTLLLHGGAAGADAHAAAWALAAGLPTETLKPDYDQHQHKAAPLLRNTQLVARAEVTLALYAPGRWQRGGTWDAARKTALAGKPLLELEADSLHQCYTPPPLLLC